jgi:hypothetical protein
VTSTLTTYRYVLVLLFLKCFRAVFFKVVSIGLFRNHYCFGLFKHSNKLLKIICHSLLIEIKKKLPKKIFFFKFSKQLAMLFIRNNLYLLFPRTCYSSAPVGIPPCLSTLLVGKRRKREEDEDEGISDQILNAFDEEGRPIDFANIISASKVRFYFSD